MKILLSNDVCQLFSITGRSHSTGCDLGQLLTAYADGFTVCGQNWFLYFFGALFNCLGLLLVVAVGGQPLGSMFNGLGKVRLQEKDPI